jgi:bacterioferritin (cytochrome b1)
MKCAALKAQVEINIQMVASQLAEYPPKVKELDREIDMIEDKESRRVTEMERSIWEWERRIDRLEKDNDLIFAHSKCNYLNSL